MKKRYIYGVGIAIVTIVVLAAILVSDSAKSSPRFNKYKQYASELNVTHWTIGEDTAEDFANANCDKLAIGHVPAIKYVNEDHVKSSAAVIAAYCPNSFDNFLAGVITDDPEYKSTALYVNERLKVDSR